MIRHTLVLLAACAVVCLFQDPGQAGDGLEASPAVVDSLSGETARAFRNRDFAGADRLSRQAYSLSCRVGEARAAAVAAANRAAVLTIQGRFDEAVELQSFADSLLAAQEDGLLGGRLQAAKAVTHFLAARKYSDGETEEALVDLARASDLLDSDDLGLSLIKACVLGRSNRPTLSQQGYYSYRALLELCLASQDSARAAVCALHLGAIEGTSGGHKAALGFYGRASEIALARGDRRTRSRAMRNIGLAHRKLANYDESETALLEALELADQLADKQLQMIVLNDLGLLFNEVGRPAAAQEMDARAEVVLRSIAEGLRSGTLVDNVLYDFHGLLRLRYANLLPYGADMFQGFCDQLVLNPSL